MYNCTYFVVFEIEVELPAMADTDLLYLPMYYSMIVMEWTRGPAHYIMTVLL